MHTDLETIAVHDFMTRYSLSVEHDVRVDRQCHIFFFLSSLVIIIIAEQFVLVWEARTRERGLELKPMLQ